MIILPDFQHSKQSSQGREERMDFDHVDVQKNPDYHFEGVAYTKERCSNLDSVEDTINYCLRMMRYAPQSRKDMMEQILMELKII